MSLEDDIRSELSASVRRLQAMESSGLFRRRAPKHDHTSLIRDDHLKSVNWWQRLNFFNCFVIFSIPALMIYGLCTIEKHYWQTWLFALCLYVWSGLGITAGYHRLWAHRAYKATPLLEWFLMVGGTMSLQGSAKWWCLLHRAHHRYTDTDDDPYDAKRGFFYSHVGWMLLDQIRVHQEVEMHDLRRKKLFRFQHKHYAWLGPLISVVLPTLFAWYFWGDLRGGFYIASCLRIHVQHQCTWCINSVAHWYGDHKFDDTISARDSWVAGVVTLGEGYHNFHHEFPNDYRNGVRWWDYDPTKWFIRACALCGVAFDLIEFPWNEIVRGKIDMDQKKLDQQKQDVDYGVPIEELPIWTHAKLKAEIEKGRVLVVVKDVVLDATQYLKNGKHPGGRKVVVERKGRDVTKDVDGAIYNHTNAARNIMSHMRVAILAKKDQ